jgi:hypothetical protein
VLADRGLFVLTVPTSQFYQSVLTVKILRKIGAADWATRYVKQLDRRFDCPSRFDEETWRKKLEAAQFHIEQVLYYCTPPQAFWFNLLTVQLFRVVGVLKLCTGAWVKRLAARCQEQLFRPLLATAQCLAQPPRDEQAGYLLLVVRKKEPTDGVRSEQPKEEQFLHFSGQVPSGSARRTS